MGRLKSKKEKQADGDAPKPRSRGSAHKGGGLNKWYEPQMQMAIDEYSRYKSFLFMCKNVSEHIQELRASCLIKSTLVYWYYNGINLSCSCVKMFRNIYRNYGLHV